MKKVLKVSVLIVGLLMVITMSMFLKMGSDLKKLEFHKVDLSEVEDGVYYGKAETTLVKVDLEVEVMNHKITRINILKHENGFGSKAEKIIYEMVSRNTYEVDAISGATASSNVIKSAVSNALSKREEID